MSAVTLSCKGITRAVRKAGIAGLLGLAGSANSSGDDVKKLVPNPLPCHVVPKCCSDRADGGLIWGLADCCWLAGYPEQ